MKNRFASTVSLTRRSRCFRRRDVCVLLILLVVKLLPVQDLNNPKEKKGDLNPRRAEVELKHVLCMDCCCTYRMRLLLYIYIYTYVCVCVHGCLLVCVFACPCLCVVCVSVSLCVCVGQMHPGLPDGQKSCTRTKISQALTLGFLRAKDHQQHGIKHGCEGCFSGTPWMVQIGRCSKLHAVELVLLVRLWKKKREVFDKQQTWGLHCLFVLGCASPSLICGGAPLFFSSFL